MRNYKVDQMRVWAAMAVVLIHVTAFLPNTNRETLQNYYWYRPILNIGVPFFFGVSGYLLEMRSEDYIQKYWKSIGLRFVVYSLFYIMVDFLILSLRYGNLDQAFHAWINEKTVYSLINGTWGQFHLWFLYALMASTYLYGVFIKRSISPKTIFLGAFVLNFMLWVIPRGTVMDSVFLYGGILKGLLYVSMGYYVASKQGEFILSKWKLCILLILYSLVYNLSSIVFMADLGMALVTYLLLENVLNQKGHPTWLNHLSEYSLDIYVIHVIFIKMIQEYGEVRVWRWLKSDLLYIFLVSVLCVIGSVLVYPLADKVFFTPVKQFIRKIR